MGKKKKGKLPKEVLGVKVPKELRKAGEKLIEQAQGPAGRQAIAGALTAVAGAVATAALSRAATARPAAEPEAEPAAAPRAGDPGEAIARVADAFFAHLSQRKR